MKKVDEKIIWNSKVIPGLLMTDKMLTLLKYRYFWVKSWQSLMLDLEIYLVRKPDKTPKDFKRFVLNCAKRRADDVKSGKRFPDGTVNLKAFSGPEMTAPREESYSKQASNDTVRSLRLKLNQLEHGTPEYKKALAKLELQKKNKSQPMLLGDIFAKINQMAEGGNEIKH